MQLCCFFKKKETNKNNFSAILTSPFECILSNVEIPIIAEYALLPSYKKQEIRYSFVVYELQTKINKWRNFLRHWELGRNKIYVKHIVTHHHKGKPVRTYSIYIRGMTHATECSTCNLLWWQGHFLLRSKFEEYLPLCYDNWQK